MDVVVCSGDQNTIRPTAKITRLAMEPWRSARMCTKAALRTVCVGCGAALAEDTRSPTHTKRKWIRALKHAPLDVKTQAIGRAVIDLVLRKSPKSSLKWSTIDDVASNASAASYALRRPVPLYTILKASRDQFGKCGNEPDNYVYLGCIRSPQVAMSQGVMCQVANFSNEAHDQGHDLDGLRGMSSARFEPPRSSG